MQIHVQKVVNAVKTIYYKDAKLNYKTGQVLIINGPTIELFFLIVIISLVSFLSIKYFCYY